MGWVSQRMTVARKIWERPWVKLTLGIWSVLASYDLFVSQLLPKRWAEKAPKLRDLIAETSGWLPVWGWVLILMAILLVALLEYAVWRANPVKNRMVMLDGGASPPAPAPTVHRDVSLLDAI